VIRWVLPLSLFFASAGAAAVVVDVIGLWDVSGMVASRLQAVPVVGEAWTAYRLGQERSALLAREQERLRQWEQALRAEEARLEAMRRELAARQDELARREAELDQRAQQLQAAEAVRQEATAREGLEQTVELVEAMRPQEAAALLARLDDATVARILGRMDRRRAAAVMALMDPDRIARLLKSHLVKPNPAN